MIISLTKNMKILVECGYCGESFNKKEGYRIKTMGYVDGEFVPKAYWGCNECHTTCAGCGNPVENDEMYYCEYCDERFCENCYSGDYEACQDCAEHIQDGER